MRVAIVGTGRWFHRVQSEAAHTQVWAVSSVYRRLSCRVDRVFEIHRPEIWPRWAHDEAKKLVTICDHPDIPGTTKLPVKALFERFGSVFTSTVSWMIALAIHQGATEIALYGVDMIHKTEYGHQRDGTVFLLGWARGNGIKVDISPDSGISYEARPYPHDVFVKDTKHGGRRMADEKKKYATVYNTGKRVYTVISDGVEVKVSPGKSEELEKHVADRLLSQYPREIKTMDDAREAGKSRREQKLDQREAELIEREKAVAEREAELSGKGSKSSGKKKAEDNADNSGEE